MEKVELTKEELRKELERSFIYGIGCILTSKTIRLENNELDEFLDKTVDRLLKEKSKQ